MENTTTIYLVRHGQTAANAGNVIQGQSDVPLDENGIQQAKLVGERLRKQHFDVILSSDLSRAKVTAAEIAGGREVIYDPELREWDLGDWVGFNLDQIKEKFPEAMAAFQSGDPEAKVPGGESRREFHDRAARVTDRILTAYPGKTVLCVSHGGLLRAIFKNITGISAHSKMIRTDNTCFCGFRYFHSSLQWQLLFWNDISHLEGRASHGGW